ncbi:hypothetical protein [uncultured Desulfosarcina sp.]|uniref:hypothetical protein n=1 Tax=uncultured Desulfosarcina sp. TaxID=218289 RepID=UPI0029C7A5AC|nr:hypothetical protein [uncultured Desulfosarcina sp.]
MDKYSVFPDKPLEPSGVVSRRFLSIGLETFLAACRYVYELPYGYNADRDDLMSLFKENKGTCTTKHAVIATLAAELNLPVEKNIGIYAMTESIVTGTDSILEKFGLPYVPMIHCFLTDGDHQVDLTEGNANGKNRSIDDFLHTETVIPNISAKDEYLKYRNALKNFILKQTELQAVDIKSILHAREEGLALLKANLKR